MKTSIRSIVIIFFAFVIVGGAFQLYQAKRTAMYMGVAYISQGMAVSQILRIEILQFHNQSGRLPDSNSEAGLPPKEEYAEQSLVSADIGNEGVITLVYNKKSGVANGTIKIVPTVNERTGRITWDCLTSSYPLIEDFIPQCRYEKLTA